jgi:molybdopterin synthase sulfurtransferase
LFQEVFALTTRINTNQLEALLENPEFILLDLRPSAAFNGWKLGQELRGGHIPSAVSFPSKWFEVLPRGEFVSWLSSKGITYRKTLILYDYAAANLETVIRIFEEMGFERLYILEDGFEGWVRDELRPIHRLEHYHKLVYPQWVKDLIDGQTPPEYAGSGFIIFETTQDTPDVYNEGHLPGAVSFNTLNVEAESDWNVRPFPELIARLAAAGVPENKTIILYGRDTTAAARVASILIYAGFPDVRVMDGGLEAWQNAGYPLEKTPNTAASESPLGLNTPSHPEYITNLNEITARMGDPQSRLVSVRSWEEYLGESSGYSYIDPQGRLPGAIWGFSRSDPLFSLSYRNFDGSMRSYVEISSLWESKGITADKRTAFYCGTGWRASEAFFFAHLIGWRHVSVYDGGWHEWSKDKENPVEQGNPVDNRGK